MGAKLRQLFILIAALLLVAAAPLVAIGQSSNQAQDRGIYANPSQAPNHSEQDLLNALRQQNMPPDAVKGMVYIPDNKAAILVQPEGRTWRDFRVEYSRIIHAALIAIAVLLVLVLAFFVGAQTYERDPRGRRLLRFRAVDRFIHWMTAVSFVLLALTGLNFVFGRILIQPWMGDSAFAAMTQWGLMIHNSVAYAFMLGVFAMLVFWLRDNLFEAVDWQWFKTGGGIFTRRHVPAGKFNAGQKMIYWLSIIGTIGLGVSGVLLTMPIATVGVLGMHWVQGVHTVIAALMIALIIGHIYLGSSFVSGSFTAMAEGSVDYGWAKTHHPLWAERALSEQEAAAREDALADPAAARPRAQT